MSATPSAPKTPSPRFSLVRVLGVGLLAAAILGGGYWIWKQQAEQVPPADVSASLKGYLAQQDRFNKLGEGYTDANGDLLADAPAADKLQDPAELTFTVVASDDPDVMEARYKPLMDLITAKTGKKVSYLRALPPPPAPATPQPGQLGQDGQPLPEAAPTEIPVRSTDMQLQTLRDGKLHITAFSTGQVPMAVNTAGFVPLFCPANDAGQYAYTMQVIVPAESQVKSLADLKGKLVALVSMSSNAGGKAPLVALKEKEKFIPNRDYNYTLTGNYDVAMYGVCVGQLAANKLPATQAAKQPPPPATTGDTKFDAASVASDLLVQNLESGLIQEKQYRSIYTSDPFPPLCFGVPHSLSPKVRSGIEAAFREFKFPPKADGKPASRAKFAAVNYATDWKAVREIDQKLTKLLD